MTGKSVDAIARFAQLLATTPSSREMQDLLVESAVDFIGADAAVLVLVDAHGKAALGARRGITVDVDVTDVLGAELIERLIAVSNGAFAAGAPMPLVAGGDLYGVLALLFKNAQQLDEARLKLAATIVDIAAATLAYAREADELAHANAELKESRRALAQAEKLRALGAMAAGISHDLKNVFGPMLNVLDILKTSTDDGPQMRENVEMMRRPLENGLAIVERLRVFSRQPGDDERELASTKAIVEDAVDLCRPRLVKSGARIDIRLDIAEAPLVRVEAADAVAGVTNLIVNALDVLAPTGGTVTVRTGTRKDGAFIDVEDTGPGVPPELRARIFDQFFTTKGKAGTGLGLAMVKEFAQRHGGSLELESPAAGGARFTLWLPAAPATQV